jgi:hypothetical protein
MILRKHYSGERMQWPDLSDSTRNRQEPVKTGGRIRSPDSWVDFLAFYEGFRPEMMNFLRLFAENSRNVASGIIVLGADEYLRTTSLTLKTSKIFVSHRAANHREVLLNTGFFRKSWVSNFWPPKAKAFFESSHRYRQSEKCFFVIVT